LSIHEYNEFEGLPSKDLSISIVLLAHLGKGWISRGGGIYGASASSSRDEERI